MNGDEFQKQQALLGQTLTAPSVDPTAPALVRFFQAHRVESVSILACVGLVALVLELVRRRQIKEKYSFLWFATGASLVVLTLKRDWLASLASLIGVYYPPTALFLVLSFFIILILVHFSMVLTRLIAENQKLAQRLALLEAELSSSAKSPKSNADESHGRRA